MVYEKKIHKHLNFPRIIWMFVLQNNTQIGESASTGAPVGCCTFIGHGL